MSLVKFGMLAVGTCALLSASAATTWKVSSVEELKAAVAGLEANDTILIAESEAPYVLDGPLTVSKSVVIRGVKADWTTEADRDKVVLDGDGKCRVISTTVSQTLRSLTIAHGYVDGAKDTGAGVYSSDRLTASNCVFVACTNAAYRGGAVATAGHGGPTTFRNCLFKDNYALGHGGVLYKNGQGFHEYTLRDCQATGNASGASGGFWYGENGDYFGYVYDCTFEGNSAKAQGGVFWGDVYVVSNCTFAGNSAGSDGGAYYANGNSHRARHTFYDCLFAGNHANSYGALFTGDFPTVDYKTRGTWLVRCTFDGNWADFRGAGAAGGKLVSIDDCTFVNNTATNMDMRYVSSANSPSGGALSGPVGRMRNCLFSNNVARCYGGAWGGAVVSTNEYFDFVCEVKGTKFHANRIEGNARFFYNTGASQYRNWGAGGSAINFSGSGIKFDTCEFVGNLCTNSYYALPVDADHPSEYGSKSAAPVYGGAIYSGSMSGATSLWGTEFTNCVFRANLVSSPLGGSCYGAAFAGMFAGSGRKMIDCVFDSNTNLSAAAGTVTLDMPDNCPALTNATHRFVGCLFTNNCDSVAALQHCWGYADLLRCKFIGNTGAGARLCTNIGLNSNANNNWKKFSYAHGEATVRDCEFRGNARQKGCAGLIVSQRLTITTEHDPEIAIRNCLFADNAAQGASSNGGALSLPALAYGTVENCTFANNSAETSGGAVYVDGNTFEKAFTNCLFCGNSAPATKGPDVRDTTGGATFDHLLFAADAKFADAEHGDYSLTQGSPARNQGVNLPWMDGARDLSGLRKRMRINEGVVDIGCYEFRPIPGLRLLVR